MQGYLSMHLLVLCCLGCYCCWIFLEEKKFQISKRIVLFLNQIQ